MQVQRDLERYREDALYFEAHREQLLVEHPEQWVAIYRNEVVGSAEELPELLSWLEERGIPRGRAFIEYVSSKDDILILSSQQIKRHWRHNRDGNCAGRHHFGHSHPGHRPSRAGASTISAR